MKIAPSKILFLSVLMGVTAYAGPSGPPPPGVPPPGLPIDGGVLFLAMVAFVYGLYKIYQLRKTRKTPA